MPTKTAPAKKKPSTSNGSSSSKKPSKKRKVSETNTNEETKPTEKRKFYSSTGKAVYLKTGAGKYLQSKLQALGIKHLPCRLIFSQALYIINEHVFHFLTRLKYIVDSGTVDKGNDWEEIKQAVKIIINNLVLPPRITSNVVPIEKIKKAIALLNAIKVCNAEDCTYIINFCKDEKLRYDELEKNNVDIISQHKRNSVKINEELKDKCLASRNRPSGNTTPRGNCLFLTYGASPPAGSNGASSSSSQPGAAGTSAGYNDASPPCSQSAPSAGGSGS